jgi:uncharacterized small protein (DUF1192 family)
MKQKHLSLEDTLPIELRIRILQAELEQIELDLSRLNQSQSRIEEEINHYQDLLAESKPHSLLRRVK